MFSNAVRFSAPLCSLGVDMIVYHNIRVALSTSSMVHYVCRHTHTHHRHTHTSQTHTSHTHTHITDTHTHIRHTQPITPETKIQESRVWSGVWAGAFEDVNTHTDTHTHTHTHTEHTCAEKYCSPLVSQRHLLHVLCETVQDSIMVTSTRPVLCVCVCICVCHTNRR